MGESYLSTRWFLVLLEGDGAGAKFEDLDTLLFHLGRDNGRVEVRDEVTLEEIEGEEKVVLLRGKGGMRLLRVGGGELDVLGVVRVEPVWTTTNPSRPVRLHSTTTNSL